MDFYDKIDALLQPYYAWLGLLIVLFYVVVFILRETPQVTETVRKQLREEGSFSMRSVVEQLRPALFIPITFVLVGGFLSLFTTVECSVPDHRRDYCEGNRYDDMCIQPGACQGIVRSFGGMTVWFNTRIVLPGVLLIIAFRFLRVLGTGVAGLCLPPLRKVGGWIDHQRGKLPVRW